MMGISFQKDIFLYVALYYQFAAIVTSIFLLPITATVMCAMRHSSFIAEKELKGTLTDYILHVSNRPSYGISQ